MPRTQARTPDPSAAGRMAAFVALWSGQTMSIFGSSMSGFALGVWVYQSTGSVTRFALITFFTSLPGIVLLPVAGFIADRFDRRWVMILSDSGAALATLALTALFWYDRLEIWHIYILMAVISTCNAPQQLAFTASVPLLVERRHLGRANGLQQLGGALAEIGAPLLGGILVVVIDLPAILLIDFATFLFAATLLLRIRIPRPAGDEERRATAAAETWGERLSFGWRYIFAQPGLKGLVLYFTALNFSRGAVLVLITPLVLSIADPPTLGRVLSLAAAGMLAGGILMTVWGGTERRIHGIFAATLLYSVMLCLGGLRPNVTLISVAAFLLISTGPVINGSVQTLWQSKVPYELQGRVFAARRMLSWGAIPLSQLVSGPLSDFVFEPLMAEGGSLTGFLGPLLGTGPGRGVGLFMTLLGVFSLLTLALGLLYFPLRRIDTEIPDAAGPESAADHHEPTPREENDGESL